MTKLGLFLMNKRGRTALEALVRTYGAECLSYVVVATDTNVADDQSEEIRERCREHGILCLERADYPGADLVEDTKVAIGWRWLIEQSGNLIVLHDSPLPAYRGFAPLVNMLVNGETELAVTAIEAAAEYDAGDILLQKHVSISYPLKIADAIDTISELYGALLVELYAQISESDLQRVPQDESKATYSPWLDEQDYFVDWTWSAAKIARFVDAVGHPFLGARTRLMGEEIWIDELHECGDLVVEDRKRHIGKVLRMEGEFPVVICGEGLARIERLRSADGTCPAIPFRSRFR